MITYQAENQRFTLETENTRYIFEILYEKYLVHLYYGAKNEAAAVYDARYKSFAPYMAEHGSTYSPDTCLAEFSGFGCGIRMETVSVLLHTGITVFLVDAWNCRGCPLRRRMMIHRHWNWRWRILQPAAV